MLLEREEKYVHFNYKHHKLIAADGVGYADADCALTQGMDGKQKMAQQGVASPKKIEVRAMGGFRPRPSSAPAKRPASARVSSAAGVRTPIPEDG